MTVGDYNLPVSELKRLPPFADIHCNRNVYCHHCRKMGVMTPLGIALSRGIVFRCLFCLGHIHIEPQSVWG